MRRRIKNFLLILCLFTIVLAGYYSYEINLARKYTTQVVLADIARQQWRKFHRRPQNYSLTLEDFTDKQLGMLITVIDPSFYEHQGIDLKTPGTGLTTITQAVVKKLYFSDYTLFSKLKQMLFARFVAHELLSKDDQLTLFVNMADMGRNEEKNIEGLQQAATTYYHKPIRALQDDEYISLVAMLIAPDTFSVRQHPHWNRERTNRIKALLSGAYRPKGLLDLYYGPLSQEIIDAGLPPASYCRRLYQEQ